MERAGWLKKWRSMAEEVYDHFGPAYWVKYGKQMDEAHRQFMLKLLGQLPAHSTILDAACGAGLYDGMLLEAGHKVLGIDQSAGMLERARGHYPQERFPEVRYAKIGLQEMDFLAEFDAAICMDAMEHICPEDWPGIVERIQRALKPGGLLYMTVDAQKLPQDADRYERAKAMGLPVVMGDIVDELDELYTLVMGMDPAEAASLGDRLDKCVYHFHPAMEHVREWFEQAGLMIETEEMGEGYTHVIARKKVQAG